MIYLFSGVFDKHIKKDQKANPKGKARYKSLFRVAVLYLLCQRFCHQTPV